MNTSNRSLRRKQRNPTRIAARISSSLKPIVTSSLGSRVQTMDLHESKCHQKSNKPNCSDVEVEQFHACTMNGAPGILRGYAESDLGEIQSSSTDPSNRCNPHTLDGFCTTATNLLSHHALYLPVAFHGHSSNYIQILGHPQIVIPVAMSQTSSLEYVPQLFVHDYLCNEVSVPYVLNLGEMCKLNLVHVPISETSKQESATHISPPHKKMRMSFDQERTAKSCKNGHSESTPLDLSVNLKHPDESAGDKTLKDKASNCVEKRFQCDCGVSFNQETTLIGHKQYYCTNKTSLMEVSREPQRKTPNRCQQCDFQPSNPAQLAQHVRINHSPIQAYICQLCGYKGYSQRGMRTHMKTHNECSEFLSDEILAKNVIFVTTDANKKYSCTKCHRDFSSRHFLKSHRCFG